MVGPEARCSATTADAIATAIFTSVNSSNFSSSVIITTSQGLQMPVTQVLIPTLQHPWKQRAIIQALCASVVYFVQPNNDNFSCRVAVIMRNIYQISHIPMTYRSIHLKEIFFQSVTTEETVSLMYWEFSDISLDFMRYQISSLGPVSHSKLHSVM